MFLSLSPFLVQLLNVGMLIGSLVLQYGTPSSSRLAQVYTRSVWEVLGEIHVNRDLSGTKVKMSGNDGLSQTDAADRCQFFKKLMGGLETLWL